MVKVQAYTDGACSTNPGRGGWGVVLIYGQHQKRECGGEPDTTNNRMELTAVIKALEMIKAGYEIVVYTDSKYVQQGITEWIANWKRNGWRTSRKRAVKNSDLWMRLDELVQSRIVEFKWIRGHNGNYYNEIADALSQTGRDM